MYLCAIIALQDNVAPFAGAWIEIRVYRLPCGEPTSLPSRERGLKSVSRIISHSLFTVAPFAGAWIEIRYSNRMNRTNLVAPFAGAWIEITTRRIMVRRSMSLPSRERGLKLHPRYLSQSFAKSLPSRERGLKSPIAFRLYTA